MPKIQLRHDTSTNWTTYNPILLEGEVAIETDTNKMKIGDGTTAYNSLEYFGGDIDLSDYYDKTETDGLLAKKQDVLTPNEPLSIRTYAKNNLTGFSYNLDGTAIYSNDGVGYEMNAESDWSEVVSPYINGSSNSNAWNNPSSGYNADSWKSYIDIPYQLGQTVFVPNRSSSVYGKLVEGGKFIPIMAVYSSSSSISIYTSDSPYFNNSYQLISTRSSVQITSTKDVGSTMVLGGSPNACISQLKESGNSIILSTRWGHQGGNTDFINVGTISGDQYVSRLKEINVVRITADDANGYNSAKTLPLNHFGLYNIEGDLSTLLEDVTNITSQENLFDISGVQVLNYLDLNIGSGLTIENGNLVNTNPTASSVMTGATASVAGTSGLVPAPQAGDDTKFLSGDGTFKTVSGSGGTVDQTYDATSTNAQSGTAVAGAIAGKVTGTGITNMVALTQAQYDALTTKDANTFYVIIPASNS